MCFEELVKRISPKLRGITYKLNGRFTNFDHEDLFQEALLCLWQNFKAKRLENKTDSYILQGCYFHLKNYIRKTKNKMGLLSLEALIDEEGIHLEEILCLKNPAFYFDDLENKILMGEIQNNRLTKREKEVFGLSLEGFTTRQIGQRLGISHVRVVKIKKNLSRKIQIVLE